MSKVEKKDPIGDFFKNVSGKSKEIAKNASSSETGKNLKEKIKGKEGFIIGGGFLILALVLFLIFGTNTFETPIKNVVDGFNKADFKTYMKALPDFVLEKEFASTSYEDAQEDFMDEIVDFREEYGQNYKLSYKVLEKTPIEVDKLYDLENDILSIYSKKVRVTEGYKVKILAIISGDKKRDEKETTYRVYKIDGKWYLTRL
ncbi:MAG: hypothetical protein IJ704_04950 [Bacilli bacterium]|nr:hypothetical protein [Bacilli bacterium]